MRVIRFWPVAAVLLAAMVASRNAPATPLYAGRSGRSCDSCHVTPNEWVDPVLKERKCTLSCLTCHVDPSGGGMRTAAGRFYGRATLPMIALSPRPTVDWDRNAPGIGRRDKATSYTHELPLGPNDFAQAQAWSEPAKDGLAHGTPAGGMTEYQPWPGRYGTLRANPAFAIGVDLRLAMLVSGTVLAFPMQLDVPIRVHPVKHLTLFANTGVRGQASGYSDAFESDHSPYFREAFLLLNEAPYQAYLKAGRFVPTYGLRLDDHTSRIRREYELDGSLPESRVTGVEIGAAPNYPVLQAAWFKMASRDRVPDAWNIFDVDDGWGASLNAGWRDLGWSLGGSGLWRRRPLAEGGDTSTYGLWGSFNFWKYRRGLPLTYQAEIDRGTFQRLSGEESSKATFYQELDWLAWNGVNLLVAHDWADPDREVLGDESHRIQFGAQITPVAGVSLDGRFRVLLPASLGDEDDGRDTDFFLQLHFWI